MVKRCVVGGCGNSNLDGVSVHQYPKDATVRQKWDVFVRSTRKNWNRGNQGSIVCGAHFKAPDDFVGWHMYQAGYKKKLDLVAGAVPSVRCQPKASVSKKGRLADEDVSLPAKKRRSAIHKLSVARVSDINVYPSMMLCRLSNYFFLGEQRQQTFKVVVCSAVYSDCHY